MLRNLPAWVVRSAEILVVALVAWVSRTLFLEHEPVQDELYHLLAAKSWVEDGSFVIADGEYARARLFTVFVGSVYSVFGENLTAVRTASAIIGVLWVVAVYAWCRAKAGITVAWITALLLCLAPGAIFLSQYVRFYSMHGLLLWLGSIAVYELLVERHRFAVSLGLGAVAFMSLGLAAHLQVTTLIGALGLFVFAGIVWWPHIGGFLSKDRRYWIYLGLAAVAAVAALVLSGIAGTLIEIYRAEPFWNPGSGPLRYHWIMLSKFPLIWAAVPVMAVLLLARKDMPGTFAVVMVIVVFALHSFSGMKGERYIYYAMPFFFLIGALALVEILSRISTALDAITQQWTAIPVVLRTAFGTASLVVIAAFLVLCNPAFRLTADLVRNKETYSGDGNAVYWTRYQSNWSAALEEIESLAASSAVTITPNGLHLLYYQGDYDFELSASRLSELYYKPWKASQEFTEDFRTGRPVISSADSLRLIAGCFSTGVIIIEDNAWNNKAHIPDETKAELFRIAERVETPVDWHLHVFRWGPIEVGSDEACGSLRREQRLSGQAGEAVEREP